MEGFKEVFSNRSAVACLVGVVISSATWMGLVIYSASFYRQRFLLPTSWVAILISGLALGLCPVFGSLLSGRFVNKFGRKRVTILGVFLLSLFTIAYTNVHIFPPSLVMTILGCFFGGVRYSASNSLTLEQVPRFRGTMMSINSAAVNMGLALGAGVGGLALLLYDYEAIGISLGAMGIAAAIIYQFLVIDPTKT